MFFGSSVWQWLQCVPSEPAHISMMSLTCWPLRFFGNTFRLVGAGKLRGGGGNWFLPLWVGGPWGAWAIVVTANTAAVRMATALAGRASEEGFKRRVSSRAEMVNLMDEILPEKDAVAG
jgi:hypothetical protein